MNLVFLFLILSCALAYAPCKAMKFLPPPEQTQTISHALMNPSKKDKYGNTWLHRAVLQGNYETVEILVNRSPILAANKKQQTALHIAAQRGYTAIAQLLLDQAQRAGLLRELIEYEDMFGKTAHMRADEKDDRKMKRIIEGYRAILPRIVLSPSPEREIPIDIELLERAAAGKHQTFLLNDRSIS